MPDRRKLDFDATKAPKHRRSLISAFVIRSLKKVMLALHHAIYFTSLANNGTLQNDQLYLPQMVSTSATYI